VISGNETTVERIDTVASADERLDAEYAAAAQDAKEKLRRAFDMLPQREREAAVLLYVENLPLREIGGIFGVSESRVCQIHSQLKRTLCLHLAENALLFSAVAGRQSDARPPIRRSP